MPKGKKKEVLGIDEGFLAEVSLLDAAGKKAYIAKCEAYKQEAQAFLKECPDIVSLKEQLKEIEGPSRDTVKACKNRQKFLVAQLRESGELFNGSKQSQGAA